ncbi:MAG TPA: DUF58 domain-containing protein [Tepidisphaeraceae bacterium]|nr:DUF58 domain-containing protein [Tepidisphaeraceae bacterium]
MSLVSRYLQPSLVERLNHMQLTARSVVQGSTSGLHKSLLKGASVEFRQHRPYVPGDEPRRLDWRLLARTDRPFVKEYDEETNLRCVIVLDRSGSMAYAGGGRATKFDYAARLVASLAYLMLAQTESVGLSVAGKSLESWLPPASGHSQLSRVIDMLERATPAGPAAVSAAINQVADRIDRRLLVIIVSDLFEPAPAIRSALARLRYARHETICLRVLDPDEQEFPFRTWSHFRGFEHEPAYLCEPALVRQSYLANFNRHRDELEEACRSLRSECHTFLTNRPMIDLLTKMLHRRAMV